MSETMSHEVIRAAAYLRGVLDHAALMTPSVKVALAELETTALNALAACRRALQHTETETEAAPPKPLSAALHDARLTRGLTQKQVGEIMGVSANTVGNWEKGQTPFALNRQRITDFLAGGA
jgi:DNA-binding transcriptional regulator YiaG